MRPRQGWGVLLVAGAVLAGGTAYAQSGNTSPSSAQTTGAQSTGATDLKLSDKPVWLGTVRLPVRVKANGDTLAPGTYRLRLTGEHAQDDVAGQSAQLERWVEFVQGTQVKGRALAPVVPPSSTKEVAKTAPPAPGRVRAERLKGDDYYRIWFNYRGDQVLIYLPIA